VRGTCQRQSVGEGVRGAEGERKSLAKGGRLPPGHGRHIVEERQLSRESWVEGGNNNFLGAKAKGSGKEDKDGTTRGSLEVEKEKQTA